MAGDERGRALLDDALAAGRRPDAVALGLAGTREIAAACGAGALAREFVRAAPACAALHAAQRDGALLDLHGLDAETATLAVAIVLDDESGHDRERVFDADDLLVVTGRGRHSPGGVSTVRADVLALLASSDARFDAAGPGAFVLRRS